MSARIVILCVIKIYTFRNVEIVAFELGDDLSLGSLFRLDRYLIEISAVVVDQALLDYLPFDPSGDPDAPDDPQFD